MFCLNSSSSGLSHVGSLFINGEQKKGLLVTGLILLPHMSALLMTPLIQTPLHKMAALTVVFSVLSN